MLIIFLKLLIQLYVHFVDVAYCAFELPLFISVRVD